MRRSIGALLAQALMSVLLVVASPAYAADRVDRITSALRESPVFVDPDVSYLLGARDRADLAERIRTAGIPIHLVVVPLLSDDESAGRARYLAYLLHRRLGRPGVYLICDQRGTLDWLAYQVPRDVREVGDAQGDGPLAGRLRGVIGAFAHAPSAAPSTPAAPDPPPDVRRRMPSASRLTGEFLKVFLPVLIGSGLVLWPVGLLVPLLIGSLRGRRRGRGTLSPRRLRRTAGAELSRLARAVGAAPGGDGRRRAVADYDAAKLLYDERSDPGSLFGVVVLALDGQDALRADTAVPEPRCALNPLHGPAAGRMRMRLGGPSNARRPLCGACLKAGAKARRPLMLVLDGRKCPYYEAPGLWQRLRGRGHRSWPEDVLEYLGVE